MVLKEGQPVKIVEGQALKHSEATAFTVVTKGGEESDEIVYSFTPRAKAGQSFTLVKESEGSGGVQVFVGTPKEGEPAMVWTAKEQGKDKAVWVAKSRPGEADQMTWVAKDGHAHAFSSTTDEEMLEKVHALQEQVQAIKAKKMDLAALEESLKKLEAELRANEEKLKELEVTLATEPHQYVSPRRPAAT